MALTRIKLKIGTRVTAKKFPTLSKREPTLLIDGIMLSIAPIISLNTPLRAPRAPSTKSINASLSFSLFINKSAITATTAAITAAIAIRGPKAIPVAVDIAPNAVPINCNGFSI